MTLEDGEVLDSRQPVEGDLVEGVVQSTMARSALWWMTTSSLVEAILDSAGPDSFALVTDRTYLRTGLTGSCGEGSFGVNS